MDEADRTEPNEKPSVEGTPSESREALLRQLIEPEDGSELPSFRNFVSFNTRPHGEPSERVDPDCSQEEGP